MMTILLIAILSAIIVAIVLTALHEYFYWRSGIVVIPTGSTKDLVISVTPKGTKEQIAYETEVQFNRAIVEGKVGEWITITKDQARDKLIQLNDAEWLKGYDKKT